MISMKILHGMKLHETLDVTPKGSGYNVRVMRVPGGWNYIYEQQYEATISGQGNIEYRITVQFVPFLLLYEDFWDGRVLGVGENNTDNSRNVEVVCPACNEEFLVDCEY